MSGCRRLRAHPANSYPLLLSNMHATAPHTPHPNSVLLQDVGEAFEMDGSALNNILGKALQVCSCLCALWRRRCTFVKDLLPRAADTSKVG